MKPQLLLLALVVAVSAAVSTSRKTTYLSKMDNLKRQISACEGHFLCDLRTTSGWCTVECVSRTLLCNGVNDCSNGYDELGCSGVTVPPVTAVTTASPPTTSSCSCAPGQYLCSDNATCVNRAQICDGTTNCPGTGDDETSCPAACVCPVGSYRCFSGDCIPIAQYCDGTLQCPNNDDEPGRCICTSPAVDAAPFCAATADFDNSDTDRFIFAGGTGTTFEACQDLCCQTDGCDAFLFPVSTTILCALLASDRITDFETEFSDSATAAQCDINFYPVTVGP